MNENPCGTNNVDHRFDVVHFDVLATTDTGTGVAIRITGAPGGAKTGDLS